MSANRSEKVALVTGGRSGIGLACAKKLHEQGLRVITAQRGEDKKFESVVADFTSPKAAELVIEEVMHKAGRLDVLVNNAGIMRESSIVDTSVEAWYETLQVNLSAPFQLIKYALPHLMKTGGNIVNVGSIEGLGANPLHAAYCASKAGLHGLTRAVAVDHGVDGVRCNAVAPGWIDTELNNEFIESFPDPADFRQRIGEIHPLRRTGAADEVAELIAWLASDKASFVTGQVLTIDGGRMSQLSLPQ